MLGTVQRKEVGPRLTQSHQSLTSPYSLEALPALGPGAAILSVPGLIASIHPS